MLVLNQTELLEVNGGCKCYCTIERGQWGINGWMSQGFENRYIGESSDVLQCTQACKIQSALCTGATCT